MSGRRRRKEPRGAPAPWVILRIIGVALVLGCGTGRAADLSDQGSPPGVEVSGCPTALKAGWTLSLAFAVDLALCNNAEVRIAWAGIRERAAAVGVARASYWPDLSLNASELNERAGYPGSAVPATNTTGKTVYGSLDWRLFDFGGRSSRYRAAQALLEAATASRDATIQQLLGEVVQAYFDAVTAKAALNDRIESESIAQQTLDSARRRETQGLASGNDPLQATAALERATLERNRAMADDQKAFAVLVYVLGLPAGRSIALPTSLDAQATAGQKDLAEWLKETERHHPAIVAARAAVQAAQDDVASARSAFRPTIDLTANYYENGFPNQGFASTNLRAATVGITVTVPLFDGFLTHYNIEEAQAAVKLSEAQLRQTRQATLMAVVEAYADARSANRNVQVSEDLLSAAQAALESSQRRYVHGVADIVELLNAQSALADARSERTRSLAEWHSARLRLLAASGVLDREEVNE